MVQVDAHESTVMRLGSVGMTVLAAVVVIASAIYAYKNSVSSVGFDPAGLTTATPHRPVGDAGGAWNSRLMSSVLVAPATADPVPDGQVR